MNEEEITLQFNTKWNNRWLEVKENSPLKWNSHLEFVLTEKIKKYSKEVKLQEKFLRKSIQERLRYLHLTRALVRGHFFTSIEDLNGFNSLNIDKFKNFVISFMKEMKIEKFSYYKLHDHIDYFLIIPNLGAHLAKLFIDNNAWWGHKFTQTRFFKYKEDLCLRGDIYNNKIHFDISHENKSLINEKNTSIVIELIKQDYKISFKMNNIINLIKACKQCKINYDLKYKTKLINNPIYSHCNSKNESRKSILMSIYDMIWGNNAK